MGKSAATGALRFPGESRKEPLRFGSSVVYFSPQRFRLLEHRSDRVDVGYNYKLEGARAVWERVAMRVRKLNQDV